MWDFGSIILEPEEELQKKRSKPKGRKPKKKGPKYRFRRIPGELQIRHGLGQPAEIVFGRIFLNDLKEKRVRMFTTGPLPEGQKVSVLIKNDDEEKRPFYMPGVIKWCRKVVFDSKIISEHHYWYRIEVRFNPLTEAAQDELERFTEEFHSRFIEVPEV